MNEDQILGKRIVFIVAHPDDETFTSAGTIFRNNQMGGSSVIICSTMGEKGSSHLEEDLTEAELAEVRILELIEVLDLLEVKREDTHTLNFPDTEVQKYHEELKDKILSIVRNSKPDIIISFDEHGLTGHEDHVAIGKIAKEISIELNLPLATFTLPPELLLENPELFQNRQKMGKYKDAIKFQEPTVVIDIDADLKDRALCLHESQFGKDDPLDSLPSNVAERILRQEYFVFVKDHLK